MEHASLLLVLAVVFGGIMAWGVGANDVANAMGTSVGSRALTLRQAIVIAIIFESLGAFFAGGHVTNTIRSQIIDVHTMVAEPEILVYGMLAALLSSGTWLVVASRHGWPVSTTHSVVGALVGFAAIGVDYHAVHWLNVIWIAMSWIGTPMIALVLGFALFNSVQRLIFRSFSPVDQARHHVLWYVFAVVFVIMLVLLWQGIRNYLPLLPWQVFACSFLISIVTVLFVYYFHCRHIVSEKTKRRAQFEQVEKMFAVMMVFTAAAMAFAHGSNDVANAVGPLVSIVDVIESGGNVYAHGPIPAWVMFLGASGIVLGLTMWGYRVIATIGSNITQLTPSRGFAAQLATASAVLLASSLGMPVSTTHTMVGAVLGVGYTRGIGALNVKVIRSIFMSWAVTLPVGALLSLLYFYVIKFLVQML